MKRRRRIRTKRKKEKFRKSLTRQKELIVYSFVFSSFSVVDFSWHTRRENKMIFIAIPSSYSALTPFYGFFILLIKFKVCLTELRHRLKVRYKRVSSVKNFKAKGSILVFTQSEMSNFKECKKTLIRLERF
jgi:hypothetical protein